MYLEYLCNEDHYIDQKKMQEEYYKDIQENKEDEYHHGNEKH
jgi:hypothetical protein